MRSCLAKSKAYLVPLHFYPSAYGWFSSRFLHGSATIECKESFEHESSTWLRFVSAFELVHSSSTVDNLQILSRCTNQTQLSSPLTRCVNGIKTSHFKLRKKASSRISPKLYIKNYAVAMRCPQSSYTGIIHSQTAYPSPFTDAERLSQGSHPGGRKLNFHVSKPSIFSLCSQLRLSIPSASSQARPAPKPRPTQAGQALRLNRSTEKTTPKDRPREERMIMEEIARSH